MSLSQPLYAPRIGPPTWAQTTRPYSRVGFDAPQLVPLKPTAQSISPATLPAFPANQLAIAALAYLSGTLLSLLPTHSRPAIKGKTFLMPTDWKAYAKVGLGMTTVHGLNNFLGIKPPPFLQGMETVAIIQSLMLGVSKTNAKLFLVMGPLIGAYVQLADWIHKGIRQPLQQEAGLPPWVIRAGLGIGMMAGGFWLLPKLYKPIFNTGWLGKELSEKAKQATMATMVTCPRGCTVGGVVCLSEIAEILGSMGQWISQQIPTGHLKTNQSSSGTTQRKREEVKSVHAN